MTQRTATENVRTPIKWVMLTSVAITRCVAFWTFSSIIYRWARWSNAGNALVTNVPTFVNWLVINLCTPETNAENDAGAIIPTNNDKNKVQECRRMKNISKFDQGQLSTSCITSRRRRGASVIGWSWFSNVLEFKNWKRPSTSLAITSQLRHSIFSCLFCEKKVYCMNFCTFNDG